MTDRQAVRTALAADDWDRLAEAPLPALDGEYPLSDAQVEGFWENGFIVLEEVLDRAEITAYGEAIRDVAMAHFRARGLALSFGGAFLQQLNLRYCSDAVGSFVQSPRFGRIASRLLRAPAVRLYHEQALFKPPGGTDSHWHQDQFYFPFDDTFTMGLWMPLVDCSLDMGAAALRGRLPQVRQTGGHVDQRSWPPGSATTRCVCSCSSWCGRRTRRATTSAWRRSCGWPTRPASR